MDVCDRDADTAEAAEQANEMKEFCDDYRIFKEKVAERCVNLTLVSELKPSPEYAQIHLMRKPNSHVFRLHKASRMQPQKPRSLCLLNKKNN